VSMAAIIKLIESINTQKGITKFRCSNHSPYRIRSDTSQVIGAVYIE